MTVEGKHGISAYYNGCRCDVCRRCNREAKQRWKANTQKELPESDPRHGTDYAYNDFACRCPECTKAHTDYQRELRARRSAS